MNAVVKEVNRDSLNIYKVISNISSLALNKLEKENSEAVWIINMRETNDTLEYSRVVIDVPTGDRQSEMVIVGPTWLPQNLTEQVDKASLIKATNFRKAINGNNGRLPTIKIIKEEDAEYLLARPEAKAERRRLKQREIESEAARNTAEVTDTQQAPILKPSQWTTSMVARAANNTLDVKEFMTLLKQRKTKLQIDDWKYLINEAPFGRVKSYAGKQLGYDKR